MTSENRSMTGQIKFIYFRKKEILSLKIRIDIPNFQ